MMGASSVSGDTLIACHFPLLPLPAWQLPVRALCGSARRPPGSSGLPRAASLPEQDGISPEHPIAISQKHFSNSFASLHEGRVDEEGDEEEEEDGIGDCVSAWSAEESKKEAVRARASQRWHNSFLPNPDPDEDDEDSDGDNLHKYREDSSFVLHGTRKWHKSAADDDGNTDWGREDFLQARGPLLGRCGPVATDGMPDHISCRVHNRIESTSEMFPNSQADDAGDSSCGSSDGILVNFCAMYDRSNNPAVPRDLSSPSAHPSPSSEGSVFLNLRPLPSERDDQSLHSPLREELLKTASCCSLRDHLPSRTLHPSERRPPQDLSSPEASDQAGLLTGTNQTYYKLVNCDLSSQSPGETWSDFTGCPEDESISGPEIHLDQQREIFPDQDFLLADTSEKKSSSATKDHIQNRGHMPGVFRINQSCKCLASRKTTAQQHITLNQEKSHLEKRSNLLCPHRPERPTSLPIQPIVLGLHDKLLPKAQPPGCLVEHYMKEKNSRKSGSSRASFKPNPKPSSLTNPCAIFMEACSSSDTCSTCTPSPDCANRQKTWFQTRRSPRPSETNPTQTDSKIIQDTASPQTATDLFSGPGQPKFVRIPTYQDLISLTTPKENHPNHDQSLFESVFSDSVAQTDDDDPDQANPLPQSPPPKTFSLAAALSSVVPLSSLGSLLSIATSGRRHRQTLIGAAESPLDEPPPPNERPPTDLSPDNSYESLSISHLQRRGLLRAVSRAVDLIIAHFGNSRDPEEKMRLGNSYLSAMMASLVLDHLCPAIQNILEDGLKDHKLDIVIGQHRNSSWTVVKVSTKPGPSTEILSSLVRKILKCPQLHSHSMKLKAFIMGLLNLRTLEFWLGHLHSQRDVVTSHYHGWGFLSMSLGRCRPLFQELLLLLQPLSVLPFELDLLLEPRLLRNGQPRPMGDGVSQTVFASVPEWRNWGECEVEGVGCSQNCLDVRPTLNPNSGKMEKDNQTAADVHVERPVQGGLRWAKLFGAANASTRLQATSQSRVKGCHRPSQWLHLDTSHVGFLTQSIRSLKP
ncbi:AP-4 complex accessory subunit RUSC2 isoform X2 [Hippocampus zosterae]|uniref:AP-4 complex accessory subunit RUSC2 isoform X2 n=1 Tax=Hippocampus zosterae TaxID=109293 RepID=UPI00223CFFDC|nr:AP-4 complex accessory subunit RUSC2 isoform X2 [Hippocampus zosterae]